MTAYKTITLRVTEEDFQQIQEMSKAENMTMSDMIRKKLGLKNAVKRTQQVKLSLSVDTLNEYQKAAETLGMTIEQYLAHKISGKV